MMLFNDDKMATTQGTVRTSYTGHFGKDWVSFELKKEFITNEEVLLIYCKSDNATIEISVSQDEALKLGLWLTERCGLAK